jgi:hypothetical protein
MGTPRYSSDSDGILEAAMLILRAYAKFAPKIAKSRIADEAAILKGLSLRFEYFHLRVPILSVYETKETNFREGMLRIRKLVVSTDLTALQLARMAH